jgi:hypothetical protein
MRRRRVFRPFLFLLLTAAPCVRLATAQPAPFATANADPRSFDATSFGEPINLGPNWLFAPGDNLAWASPTFDDGGWKTISSDKQLLDYDVHDIPYAWYRIHIHLRPGTHKLTIGLVGVSGNYEVYANGLRIGGDGNMTGLVQSEQDALIPYAVPDSAIAPSGNLVLAIRFAINRGGNEGRGTSTPLNSHAVYLLSQWEAPFLVSYVVAHAAGPPFLLCCLALIAGLVSFALYIALRTQLEYLAIAIYLFAASACMAVLIWTDFNSSFAVYSLMWVALCVENFALIEFVRLVLHLPRTRWLLLLEIASSLAFFVPPANSLGIASTYVYFGGFFVPVLVVKIILPALLLRGFVRGNRDAGVLLPAILLGSLADYWRFLCDLVSFVHFAPLYPLLVFSLPIGSYQIGFYRLGDLIFYIAVLLFLVLRTVGIARDRARAAAELEAARTTQQLLLARSAQPTPGFHVETIYHPDSEVGGDFFLVASTPDGGLLAIVGDVSGKGLMAAMRVAMILGVLRREDGWEPAAVLHNLNEALLTQDESGFTTACCVQVEPDGRYTLANAGHIAPYIDGHEVAAPPALPLGLAPDQHYATVSGNLSANQRIVMLSDGVVEARSTSGELFGFERLAQLTLKSAREIADTAKNFGQQDDITVLTLTRLASGEDSMALRTSPALAPA